MQLWVICVGMFVKIQAAAVSCLQLFAYQTSDGAEIPHFTQRFLSCIKVEYPVNSAFINLNLDSKGGILIKKFSTRKWFDDMEPMYWRVK